MKALVLSIVVLLLSGCLLSAGDRWSEISAGIYASSTSVESESPMPWRNVPSINSVFIDREHQTAWIIYDDASLVIRSYDAWPRDRWPTGCPTNLGATHMEVVDLGEQALSSGAETIPDPILVRECPPSPVGLALRDAGDIAGGGAACTGAQVCTVLGWTVRMLTFPSSTKGYELYSWQADDTGVWAYTLITGTNRTKTWEEIAATDSTITEEGWIKVTVREEAALKSVLDRVPEGAHILWVGPGHPLATGALSDRLRFPDADTVREIETYSRRRDLSLGTGG